MEQFWYEETTEGITIKATAQYIHDRSRPLEKIYYFIYSIVISNHRANPAKLLKRHWVIRDGQKREEHVRGEGVVGETPTIIPGEDFSYHSACPIKTPTGSLRGSYQFICLETGKEFEVTIPLIFLRKSAPMDQDFESTNTQAL